MVAQNHVENRSFVENKCLKADQVADYTLQVHTNFWATIYCKYHVCNFIDKMIQHSQYFANSSTSHVREERKKDFKKWLKVMTLEITLIVYSWCTLIGHSSWLMVKKTL